ncbi:DUF6323 family protein [Clostridium sp. AL.422]|uniref:DUF6323 family protein n=1 Tax=Clostridium TaxID=1485 RepID=UPI00293DCC74|nr:MULTISPECIES: DUF6323 family protein [unclassified Clostridium]MDV4149587.1 DUF6323 family protein [Clostridium sp. AL.422]
MNEIINFFQDDLSVRSLSNEILKCNEHTIDYGLKLSEHDVQDIIKTRKIALEKSGRIEFNGQIINKMIEKFCDSPYISQYNYSETISELLEIFYNYKNETLDYIGDDELIDIMRDFFDGYCQGSLELLEGRVLYNIADNIRHGVRDYTNINKERSFD